ncbi:Fe-S protein assembly co-chaperone HscB [Sulfuritalea hydrogenivorans]|jgi:molecular chaperone HscB|uniref:Co-chaperone protein HscB homolog n=1 Tax=Sulfuritalea hydrogenivorans sk43H TaxID=1223802 RepID=W0SF73_9PROT|nr:Fe-S protein assembly co-chaperone HscB [Sulfuritalea hydrogenivorans]MDK9715523.1 Fe-S protein assembly co-chaperone HscB [Sulfuritalea sp.]BAO29400.1 co-chaperone HscB [Sulfuritalea hydrogenivorans sk43H]
MTTFDLNFAADHFTLFGLPRAQSLDLESLEKSFRAVQAQVHPDKHAQAADADRRLAMQWATRINEAFQTLKSPGKRARYLLHLLGHDPQIESNTAMPAEFLMSQMELREAVMDARAAADEAALDEVRSRLLNEIKAEYLRVAELIDKTRDYTAAADLVRQLMFQEKLLTEIDDALEAVTA